MAGRPKYYNDEELIDRATVVFWKKGYNAAGAQDLMEAMKIGQGSFYRSFPGGKKELYQKSLVRFLEKSISSFKHELLNADDPVCFIKNFFRSVTSRKTEEKSNGCYLGNAIVELSNLDADLKEMAVDLLSNLKKVFESAFREAQEKGKLKCDLDAEVLALHLINLWNGINVTQRMYPNHKKLEDMIEFNLKLLE